MLLYSQGSATIFEYVERRATIKVMTGRKESKSSTFEDSADTHRAAEADLLSVKITDIA